MKEEMHERINDAIPWSSWPVSYHQKGSSNHRLQGQLNLSWGSQWHQFPPVSTHTFPCAVSSNFSAGLASCCLERIKITRWCVSSQQRYQQNTTTRLQTAEHTNIIKINPSASSHCTQPTKLQNKAVLTSCVDHTPILAFHIVTGLGVVHFPNLARVNVEIRKLSKGLLTKQTLCLKVELRHSLGRQVLADVLPLANTILHYSKSEDGHLGLVPPRRKGVVPQTPRVCVLHQMRCPVRHGVVDSVKVLVLGLN